jgi:hypothetical protein
MIVAMEENNSLEALIDPGEAEDFFEVAGLGEFEPSVTRRSTFPKRKIGK